MKLKFTVITVTYNCASTIERAIKSVLSQKYHDIEYIIMRKESMLGIGTLILLAWNRDIHSGLACLIHLFR